jgi:hypothetical protein
VQWCSFGNSNAFWGSNCSWTALCSNMGMSLIQLGQGAGTEEVFLVYGVLAVGGWSSSDGSNHIMS